MAARWWRLRGSGPLGEGWGFSKGDGRTPRDRKTRCECQALRAGCGAAVTLVGSAEQVRQRRCGRRARVSA